MSDLQPQPKPRAMRDTLLTSILEAMENDDVFLSPPTSALLYSTISASATPIDS